MYFCIVNELDMEAKEKSKLIHELGDELTNYFATLEYGEGIHTYYLRCICIKTKPGYEKWHIPKRTLYKSEIKANNLGSLEEIRTIKNYFSNEFRIDNEIYDKFITGTDLESMKILANEIIKALKQVEKLPKRVKNFDKNKFTADLNSFFQKKNLI